MTKHRLLALALLLTGTAGQSIADIAYLAVTDGYWQVWVMNDDGSNPRQITASDYDKARISWYPDGMTLLVNGNDGLLRSVAVDTGDEEPIELELSGMLDAMIDPSGEVIVFSLSTSGSIDDNNIWTVTVDGHNPSKLTQLAHMQHEPVWSLDGGLIYFLSGDGGQAHDIWQVSPRDRSTQQLTVGSLYHFDIAAGPTNQLAFSSNRSGNYEIWVAPVDFSSAPTSFTSDPALDARPTWSPSGTQIAFESSRSGAMQIWLLNIANGDQVQLTQHPDGARFPVWGPAQNGESINE